MFAMECNKQETCTNYVNQVITEITAENEDPNIIKEKVGFCVKSILNRLLDLKPTDANPCYSYAPNSDYGKYYGAIQKLLTYYSVKANPSKTEYLSVLYGDIFSLGQAVKSVGFEIYDRSKMISSHVSTPEMKQFLKNYQDFQETKRFIDFTIVCNGQNFSTNGAFLAARCPYFSTLFNNAMQESLSGKYVITEERLKEAGTNSVSFQRMLNFIYTDEVDLSNDSLESCVMLLACAELFGMEELKKACIFKLARELNAENAEAINAMAELYSIKELKSLCELYV